jgi:glycosyltransferase involved in cell wall biosynthesis
MCGRQHQLSYVLISPVQNEEKYIEKTIQAVVSQSVLPEKWIIVSNGSTDKTEAIVNGYLHKNMWIELLRLPERNKRNFSAKVCAFNAGYQSMRSIKYDVIGNIDGDISFENDYMKFLLDKFYRISELGVAGTPFIEDGYSSMTDSFEGEKHVAGGCQLFRRKCFEMIGGYQPINGGGVDWVAVTTARMMGWKTMSFPQKQFFHHRSLGTAQRNSIGANFDYGLKDYYLGGHPIWQVFRMLYRLTKKPYLLGGLAMMSGYLWGSISKIDRQVSCKLMAFHRKEQMLKLKNIFENITKFRKVIKYHNT